MLEKTQLKNISTHDFEKCLKCTICTVYCPVAAVEPRYRGPKEDGPDTERYRLKDPKYFDEMLKLCLNCKRCEVACPEGVKVGDIIQAARIKYSTHRPSLRDRMLANTDFVGGLATAFAPIVNFSLGLSITKKVLDSAFKIDKQRQFPSYTHKKFESWYKKHEVEQAKYSHHVSYFHGCYANYNYPQLGKDFVKVMNAVGYGVNLLEKEKCCGVALIANGFYNQAKQQGETNIHSIRNSIKDNEAVLTTSSTCTFTIRDEYKALLDIHNDDVREKITLATRFLYKLLENDKIKLAFRKDFKKKVAYHTACHMERMGWAIYSIELLKMIPGLDLTILESRCCGIAGTYGFKKENYQNSQKIGALLFKQIREVNPEIVATDCETCKWQIEMSTGYKVENPISLIAQALDVEETKRLNHVIK